MAVIDNSVVRIGPDFKGFKALLEAGLKKATASVSVKVRVIPDLYTKKAQTQFRREAMAELKKVGPLTVKVKLVADGGGISGGSRPLKQQAAAAKETAQVVETAAKKATKAEDGLTKAIKAQARELVRSKKDAAKAAAQTSKERAKAEREVAREIAAVAQENKRARREALREMTALHAEALAMDQTKAKAKAKAEADARKAEARAEKARKRQYRLIRDPEDIVESHRVAASNTTFKRLRTVTETFLRDEELAWREHGRRLKSDQDAAFASYATNIEDIAKLHEQALALDQQYNRIRMSRARTAGEAIAGQELAARAEGLRRQERAHKEALDLAEKAERASLQRRKSIISEAKVPKLIDLGGEGVRPMNALIGAAVALSPVLIAVASSAVQAGTSIAALGSAAYGGTLAVVGLTAAFAGVLGALKLHSSLQKAQIGQGAKAAATTQKTADAARQEKSALKDLSGSYKEAAQKVKDLRLELQSLRVQQSGNALDVEEADRKMREVNSNFFATDLMKRQAKQDLVEARQRGKEIANNIGKTRSELTGRVKAGLGGSPEVTQARNSLAAIAPAAASTLAPMAQLDAALKDLSPAARDLYDWLVANTEQFKKYRRSIEQAILPGFLSFLKDVTAREKGAKSTTDVLVDGITGIGRQISRTTANLGKLAKTKWFKGELLKLNRDNEKAFSNVGDAAVTMVRPITRLFTAASPLIVRFSGYLKSLAQQFSGWIDSFSDKDLAGWFKRAGDELAKWWKIATDLGSTLLSIFQASLPSGNNLVSRLGELTGRLAEWAKSDSGQAQIRKFFEFFQKINYGQLTRIAASIAGLLTAWKLGAVVTKSPFYAFLGLLATKWPDTAAKVLESAAGSIAGIIGWIDGHPEQAATLLGILTGLKLLNKVKPIGDIFKNVPGMDKLFSIFGDRGANPANPLFVSDIAGGGIPGGAPGKVGSTLVKGGLIAAAAAAAYEIIKTGIDTGSHGVTPAGTITKAIQKPSAASIAKAAVVNASPAGFVANQASLMAKKGPSGWLKENLKQAGNLGKGLKDVFTGLAGKAGGWLKGVWDAVADWFADLGHSIGTWASDAWHGALDFFKSLPGRLLEGLKALPGDLAYLAGQIVGWIIVGIVKGIPALWGMLKKLVGYIWTGMLWIKDKVAAGISAALDFFKAMPGRIWRFIRPIPGLVWDGLKAIGGFVKDVVTGALEFFRTFPGKAVSFIKGLPDQIKTAISAIPGFFSAMWAKIKGLWRLGANGAIDLLNSFLSGVNSVTKNFGIEVPHNIPHVFEKLSGTPGSRKPGQDTGSKKDPLDIDAADGGRVPGFSPNARADNIPARVTAGEWIHPVKSVQKYGHGFMKAVQEGSYEPAYADGGLVGAVTSKIKPPFIRDLAKGVFNLIPSAADLASLLTGGRSDAAVGGGTVSGDPGVARIAEATARSMGATDKQLVALIAAGLVESGMRNINFGDRDSVGFLQQRPSQGWGSVAQLLDVAYATRKFIAKAKQVDSPKYTAGQLAQAVQVSAFPDRYDQRAADATAILNQYAPFLAGSGGGGGGGSRAALVAFGRWLQQRGYDVTENSAFGGVHGGHASGSQHYRDNAIDVNHGAGTSAREQRFLRTIIPEGHRRGLRSIFMTTGHYNHAHFDLGPGHALGGLVKKYDGGGVLNPGVTMAVNNTGKPETVRTAEQEKALNDRYRRIDPRDLALLASYIVNAISGQSIRMDGRKVAETVRGYDYLPRGI